jgi:uncharacterized protein
MLTSLYHAIGQFAPFEYLADLVVYRLFGFSPNTTFGEALHFFIGDVSKIFALLTIVVFVIAIIRSYFPPEKVKKYLAGRGIVGNVLAASLGIVTPFCSCSAVPMFIGFVESGVPLGVTFSFLISAPTVNEVALILLWGLFGWKIALLYIATGLAVAIVGGVVIGRLNLERFVEEYVFQTKFNDREIANPTWHERTAAAWIYTKDLLKGIWPYIVFGIGIAAGVHGWVPVGFVARVAGPDNPFAVIIAVLLGIPLYSNAAGTIPIVQVLVAKGLPLGTALAFMMSVTAISLPELIILRKVLKPRLLAIFVGVVSVAIIFLGYLFNAILR